MKSQDKRPDAEGQLFIVATPIGNLNDITYRAVDVLRAADVIAVEDTRVSGRLLKHLAITTPMLACHEHNEEQVAIKLIRELESGYLVALISDAGTPLINDPGYRLVKKVRDAGYPVIPVPGPCSPIAALCVSGLATDQFTYAGFFPRSGRSRSELIEQLKITSHTYVLLESPRRLLKTINGLCAAGMAEREICVARELTKLHESVITGSAEELARHYSEHEPRGEIVLMVGPSTGHVDVSDQDVLCALQSKPMQALPPSQRAGAVAKELGLTKSQVYALMLEHQNK